MRFPVEVPDGRKWDVLGFGTNAVDYLVVVPEYPTFNSKIRLTNYVQAAGGEVATTLAALARLGMKATYAGRFGSDAEGDFGIESLRTEGVEVGLAQRVEGARTQIAFILIDESSGERTVIWERDDRLSYKAEEAPKGAVSDARIFHFTPHDAAECKVLAEEAKAAGTVVSIDIDNIFDGVERVLPLVDVMIASADFPGRLFGISDPELALREMHVRYGCTISGMTLGEEGSIIFCDGTFIRNKGFAVPGGCKDTTGAGDAFRAGLLYGLLKGETLEDAGAMANAVAALKCRAIGARTALPTVTELQNLLASRS